MLHLYWLELRDVCKEVVRQNLSHAEGKDAFDAAADTLLLASGKECADWCVKTYTRSGPPAFHPRLEFTMEVRLSAYK